MPSKPMKLNPCGLTQANRLSGFVDLTQIMQFQWNSQNNNTAEHSEMFREAWFWQKTS